MGKTAVWLVILVAVTGTAGAAAFCVDSADGYIDAKGSGRVRYGRTD